MSQIDATRYCWDAEWRKFVPSEQLYGEVGGASFIKGPIPIHWLRRAGALPGRSLLVGLALWYLAGVRGGREFTVSTRVVRELYGVDRFAKMRALRHLARAGLIEMHQRGHAAPIIRLITSEEPKHTEAA